jgi:glycosyltransferase involved in cell wall biosynthesis
MKRPLRIAFDVAQTCQERAGCGWYADALIRALAAEAPENTYLLYHHFDAWINPDTSAGTFLDVPQAEHPMRSLGFEEAAGLWRSINLGEAPFPGGPDIVHANSHQAPRVSPARLVYTVYDVSFWTHPQYTTDANRLVCQQGLIAALDHADGLLFISESTRRDFQRVLPGWLEASGIPSAVTLLGPRAPAPPPPDAAPERPSDCWLAVGTLEPRKNYEALLDALNLYWPRSANPRPLLIAGGSGWKSEPLKRRLAELETLGRVQLLGYVPDPELAQLYTHARALVFPSWNEGFGLPVLEAMGHGCPVICSRRASLPEVGGDAAIYIDPARPESICEAMLEFESTPHRREQMAAAGLAQAARFSWEKTARETVDFYERVLAAPLRPSIPRMSI